jgi:hypothetical protein
LNEGPNAYAGGDSINLSFSSLNATVVSTDPPNGGSTFFTLPQLPAGGTAVFKVVIKPTAAAAQSGQFDVVAGLVENLVDLDPLNNSSTVHVNVSVPNEPDLSAHWTSTGVKRTGPTTKPAFTITGTLLVTNQGPAASPPTTATFYLSADAVLDAGDTPLKLANGKPVTAKIPAIAAHGTKQLNFTYKLPAGTTSAQLSGKYVIAKLDPANGITEIDEGNNTAAGGPLSP